jgi:peptidylprolyl isomerase
MAEAKQGDTVKVHYTVRLEDGTILGSTPNHKPLQFAIGGGEILPGFEQAIVGMNPGESKTVQVPADEAFGPHQEEMIVVVGRNRLPADLKPKAGESLLFRQEDGKTITVMVTDVSESSVTIDANHPLAGKDLTFDIQFIEIL